MQKAEEVSRRQEEQFEEVFLAHWPRVVGLLSRLVGDPAEAEDLALETFLRLHTHVSELDPGHNPGGWLYRVASHLGLDAIRRWRRREHYELDAGKLVLEESPVESPLDLLARKEATLSVRKILAEMPPRTAQLLILRYSGFSYQEIAVALKIAPSSVGPLLLRAEKDFRRRYAAAGLEE